MSRIKSVTFYNWRQMKGKDFQTPLLAPRTPSNTPKHPWTLQNTPLAMSWICQGWYGSVSGYLRVSVGSWRAYGRLRGVFGSLFPSFAFNSRKSQIRFVTFSSRPGGPRCLKYQNVPELRSFWAIGKPRERFQSWVIRVYFLTVPDDHTVFSKGWTVWKW